MKVKNAVLVSLHVTAWDANRRDARLSEQVASENEVQDQRLCRLRKSLFPRNDAMKQVYGILREVRNFHYKNTHAWMFDGPRILMTTNYEAYMREIRAYKAKLEPALQNLKAQYDTLKEEARKVLGKLYNPLDYPEASKMITRFGIEVSVQGLPDSSNLLELGLETTEAQELRTKLEADMQGTFERANRRMWEDLYNRLNKLVVKLGSPDETIRKGALNSVMELADLLPKLNITNDAGLDAMAQRLKDSLGGFTAEGIQANPNVRAQAAERAASVFNVMQTFMRPNGAAQSGTEVRRAA